MFQSDSDLDGAVRRAHARVMLASRVSRGGGKGDPERVAVAQANFAFAKLHREIVRTLRDAPPMTPDQSLYLAKLLLPGDER